MAKSKGKKSKRNLPKQKNGNGNPFEGKSDETIAECGEYPTENNPFLEKKTKSMRKADKEEKKREKKEQKQKKKEDKSRNGEKKKKDQIVVSAKQVTPKNESLDGSNNFPRGSSNDTSALPPIQTRESENPAQKRSVTQTLDNCSEKPPQICNKGIEELRTAKDPSKKTIQSSVPDPTLTQSKRPQSLNVKPGPVKSKGALSPVREQRYLSPLAARAQHHGNEEIKMYRRASISKSGKDKKTMKKMKKLLKKKKKSKAKEGNLLEDQVVAEQVVMRRPKPNRIQELQQTVAETQESIRSSVINLVEQRNSQLDIMVESTIQLEEKSLGFATVAQEGRLKMQARSTCCGMWKNWKACWYICACQRKVKKNKKWEDVSKEKSAAPEAHKLLSRYSTTKSGDCDDDDYYRPADQSSSSQPLNRTSVQINIRPPSTNYSTEEGEDTVDRGTPSLARTTFGKMPKAIGASLPNLQGDTPKKQTSSKDAQGRNLQIRRSSSTGDIHEIAKNWVQSKKEAKQQKQKEKRRNKKEKGIKEFASQYEDEETRNKVEDLLRLDLDSPEN